MNYIWTMKDKWGRTIFHVTPIKKKIEHYRPSWCEIMEAFGAGSGMHPFLCKIESLIDKGKLYCEVFPLQLSNKNPSHEQLVLLAKEYLRKLGARDAHKGKNPMHCDTFSKSLKIRIECGCTPINRFFETLFNEESPFEELILFPYNYVKENIIICWRFKKLGPNHSFYLNE